MQKGDILDLKIEKLVYGGEGLGRIDDTAVFVNDVAVGDQVKAEVVSVKKTFAKAVLLEVTEKGSDRVTPFCPYAKVCGGCQWQHISYEGQLAAKREIIEETVRKIAGTEVEVKEVIKSPEVKQYRCKVQLPVQQTKVSKRFLMGYYKKATHEIVNTKLCPVQPVILDRITAFIKKRAQELKLTAYDENRKKGLIRHIVYRFSKTNSNLTLTVVINERFAPDGLNKLLKEVKAEFRQIVGVLINFNKEKSNVILGQTTSLIDGQDFVEETLGNYVFKISATSFFQVNPSAAAEMFSEVKKIIQERVETPTILDVYAGAGSFSVYLSDIASSIKAVEESESSVNDGLVNIKRNNAENISFIKGNADDELKNLVDNQEKFDVIILDPPRKGCSKEVTESIKHLAEKYVIYVSCNPSTLARDIALLQDDFTLEFIQPVDMFCHTYHVESIALLRKK